MFHSSWKNKATTVAAATMVAIAIVGGAIGWRVTQSSSESAGRVDSPLLTGNRTEVSICVEDLTSAGTVDVASVQQAAADVKTAPSWARANLDGVDVRVVAGCDAEPHLLSAGVTFKNGGFIETGDFGRTDSPSEHRLMVFILDDAETERLFGDAASRTAVQESLCEGGVCSEVTTGLYLSASEVSDVKTLAGRLSRAIGILPPAPPSNGENEVRPNETTITTDNP